MAKNNFPISKITVRPELVEGLELVEGHYGSTSSPRTDLRKLLLTVS
jgi:hypothetical protein